MHIICFLFLLTSNERVKFHSTKYIKFNHFTLQFLIQRSFLKQLIDLIPCSENGKLLASCADDRSVLIWFTKDFSNKEHKCVRANIPFDHATKIKWSPDSKAFLVHCATSNELQVHKVKSQLESRTNFQNFMFTDRLLRYN